MTKSRSEYIVAGYWNLLRGITLFMRLSNLIAILYVSVGFSLSTGCLADNHDLPEIEIKEGVDFYTDGHRARTENRIIMLLVSQTHCPYCVQIKEEIIFPMLRAGDYKDQLLIREILIDTDRQTVDFSGKHITASNFANNYRAYLTPTLLFLGPDGQELTERMVGINTPEMYFYYVDESIKQALEKR